MKKAHLLLAFAVSLFYSQLSGAAVINSNPISSDVIVIGDNGLEFVYGAVTSPDSPCCGVEVTLTQGFRLPTVEEMVGGFGTLTGLLTDFNLIDNDDLNNIVAFEYFNNLDVAPFGNVGDVRAGYVNNLDFGAAFYDFAGSAARVHANADFFFVRGAAQSVPEPSALALLGLGLVGIGFVAKRKASKA